MAHKFRFKVVKSTLPKARREAVGRRVVDAGRAAEANDTSGRKSKKLVSVGGGVARSGAKSALRATTGQRRARTSAMGV